TEPGINCTLEIAERGRKSQLTTSPNASLMRTPSWNTDMPCGVPSSGDAEKPRKSSDCWYALPCPDAALTLFEFWSKNCVSVRGRVRANRRLSKIWTLAGTSRSGVPNPGNGAVPTTCTEGSSNTSAGLSAAPACAAAAPTTAATADAISRRARVAGTVGRCIARTSARNGRRAWDKQARSVNDHAPRQLADGHFGDLLVRLRVHDRHGIRTAAGDVELAAVGCQRHVPRSLADGGRRDDRVRRRVDHLHSAVAAGGDVDALSVGIHDDAVGPQPGLDRRDQCLLRDVDHRHRVRVLGRNVRAAAVGQKAYTARTLTDGNRFDDFAARDVDDVHTVGLLGADEDQAAVGAEDGVLGVLALHRDALGDRQRSGIDDQHLVVLLD